MLRRLKHQWRCLTRGQPEPIVLDAKNREPLANVLCELAPNCTISVPKRRYGSPFDGGYVMVDDFSGITEALSLGIGGNVKWDLAMAKKGIRVLQYDHTVEGPPAHHANFEFHKTRIGAEDEASTPTRSLSTLMAGRTGNDMILKIDIEGAEWEVFAEGAHETLKSFRQILVEFHGFRNIGDPTWYARAMRALDNLNRLHRAVHIHGNNFGPIVSSGDVSVTDGLELTYVRKDAYSWEHTDEHFPGPYDRPNNPYRPDVRFRKFSKSPTESFFALSPVSSKRRDSAAEIEHHSWYLDHKD